MIGPSQDNSNSKSVVVVGCGRVGIAVATGLAKRGCSVHVLDVNASAFDQLPRGRLESSRITPVHGDGTLEADLVEAGIADAEAMVAVTGNDNINALVALSAARLYGVTSAVCRIDDPEKQQTFQSLGLTTVSSTALLAEHLVDCVVS